MPAKGTSHSCQVGEEVPSSWEMGQVLAKEDRLVSKYTELWLISYSLCIKKVVLSRIFYCISCEGIVCVFGFI